MGHHVVSGVVIMAAGRWGHMPSLRSGSKTGAFNISRIRGQKGRFGKTGPAVV